MPESGDEFDRRPRSRCSRRCSPARRGRPLVTGNEVRLLRDAGENYPAWLEAIAAARRTIHFESYIIHDDETGQEFARALEGQGRARACGCA